MGTPSKRRKLNEDSKPSPAVPSRNLDFFFGKQNHALPSRSNSGELPSEDPLAGADAELSDEQLARKLQAEFDQEDPGAVVDESSLVNNDTSNGVKASISTDSPGKISVSIRKGSKAAPEDEKTAVYRVQNHADSHGHDMKAELSTNSQSERKSMPFQVTPKENTLSLQSAGSAEDAITSKIPFDQSPLTFDPSNYVTDLQSHWAAESGNASYALLTRCFVLVNSTQSRIKIVDTLVNLLRVIIEGDPSSLLPTVRTLYCFDIYMSIIVVFNPFIHLPLPHLFIS
jgi:DNA ligase-1